MVKAKKLLKANDTLKKEIVKMISSLYVLSVAIKYLKLKKCLNCGHKFKKGRWYEDKFWRFFNSQNNRRKN